MRVAAVPVRGRYSAKAGAKRRERYAVHLSRSFKAADDRADGRETVVGDVGDD